MVTCNESQPYMFVSYSHRDSDEVVQIIERLNSEGFNIWYDQSIAAGTEWDENIAIHVQECAYFVAFVSKNYIESNNCKDELNFARDNDKNILLVYLEHVELPIGMAMRMNRLQAIMWHQYNYQQKEAAYHKLMNASGIDIAKISSPASETSQLTADMNTRKVQTQPELKVQQKPVPTQQKPPVQPSPVQPRNTAQPKPQRQPKQKKQSTKRGLILGLSIAGGCVLLGILFILFVFLLGSGAGSSSSQLRKGVKYLHGDGKEYNPVTALSYFEQEAEKGNQDAYFMAGYTLMYELDHTEHADDFKAVEYLKKCNDNNACSDFMLGIAYQNGYGVTIDEERANEYYDKALSEAETTYINDDDICKAEKYFILAKVCERDYLDYHDYKQAMMLYQFSSDNGNVRALYQIGDMYYYGRGVDQSYETAIDWYEQAVNKGFNYGYQKIANMYFYGEGVAQDYATAFEWFEHGAEHGITNSMYSLGYLYFYGLGVSRDYATASEWFLKAAEGNEIDAFITLGQMYYEGIGVNQDYDQSIYWLSKVPVYRDPEATIVLGDAYFCKDEYANALETYKEAMTYNAPYAYGRAGYLQFLNCNFGESVSFFEQGGYLDDAYSCYALGYMYYNGEGVTPDEVTANQWFEKAKTLGYNVNDGNKTHFDHPLVTEMISIQYE